MARMKKFLLYFVMFIAFFIFTTLMINWATTNMNDKIEDIEITVESPVITVHNCNANKYSGNVNGVIRNDTGKLIEKIVIKVEAYDEEGYKVGSGKQEINYFNVNETTKFNIDFVGEKTKSVKIFVEY